MTEKEIKMSIHTAFKTCGKSLAVKLHSNRSVKRMILLTITINWIREKWVICTKCMNCTCRTHASIKQYQFVLAIAKDTEIRWKAGKRRQNGEQMSLLWSLKLADINKSLHGKVSISSGREETSLLSQCHFQQTLPSFCCCSVRVFFFFFLYLWVRQLQINDSNCTAAEKEVWPQDRYCPTITV